MAAGMSRLRTCLRSAVPWTAACFVAGLLSVVFLPRTAGAVTSPPPADMFYMSSLTVTPGSQVALHWSPEPGAIFILTSAAPNDLPDFGTGATTWPPNSWAAWRDPWHWWVTTADEVTVSIPGAASNGTEYDLQLYTCNTAFTSCSNASGSPGDSTVALTVSTAWSTRRYSTAFSSKSQIREGSGAPLDVAIAGGTLWNSSEFSNGISDVPFGSLQAEHLRNPANGLFPFAACFGSCQASEASALSERIVAANGTIWSTFGGWLFDTNQSVENHSEIAAFNPESKTYCTYLVPGDDNEVIGLAVSGSPPESNTWFVESGATDGSPSLDWFNPAQVGDGCPRTSDEIYSLNGALHRVTWPTGLVPGQVAVDQDTTTAWVTDMVGSEIDKVDSATGQITSYHLPTSNRYAAFGAFPWQIVTDRGFVYAIDYGDSSLVRIDKATNRIDVVRLPLTSDVERGYGLALHGGKLYFTLSDDGQPSVGGASTFGYISVGAWEFASRACQPQGTDCAPSPQVAVVYSGVAPPNADLRGIAVGPAGDVAIADLHGVIWLTP